MKLVNLAKMMVEGLEFSEKGYKAHKTKTLNVLGVENASETFFTDVETAQRMLDLFAKTKSRAEVSKTVKVEDYLQDVTDEDMKADVKLKKGKLADVREFLEMKGLTDEFSTWLNG